MTPSPFTSYFALYRFWPSVAPKRFKMPMTSSTFLPKVRH